MKYYYIKCSTSKDIGRIYPQSLESNHFYPQEAHQIYAWKKNIQIPKNFKFPTPILRNGSNLTDLISHSGFYSNSLLVSERFKNLILEFSIKDDTFHFETILKTKKGDYKYWDVLPIISRDEYIDFENTNIELQKGDLSEKAFVVVRNNEEYKKLLENEIGKNYILLKGISLNKLNKPDFFCIKHISNSIGFIISNKLRQIMIAENYTGIRFEEL